MKKYNKFLIVIYIFLFIGSLMFNGVSIKAEEAEKNIIVVIDNSGSMQENDESKLALAAASMLVDTVDLNKTKINIIAFGDKVTYIKKLSERPNAEELKNQISSIKYVDQHTNSKEGIAEALSQLKEVNGDKNIILLSDGKEDVPGETDEQHAKKLNELIREAQDMKVRINTIGLSEYSDKAALSDIANKTQGNYFSTENAAGLFDIFSKILGNINGFYTIERFSTNESTDKTIKVSSFIEEVIVNVLSSNKEFPLVSVSNDKNVKAEYKSGDRYAVYRIKNDGSWNSNNIRISSSSKTASSVIVQIKSKVGIDVNTSSDSFEIPYSVQMSVEASIKTDKEINDLQLYKIDGEDKSLLAKSGNSFRFNFKKDKPGYYSTFLIACDGNGNIISGKYFNITVTDDVPFNYASQFSSTIYTGKDVDIKLEQLDSTKLKDAGGDIYVWYEGSNKPQVFALKFEAGALKTKINLKEAGKVKLSAQIRAIKEEDNDESFYFLPPINSEVIEVPYIKFESEAYKKPYKENEPVTLNLKITDNKLTKEETMLLLDSNNKEIKKFTVRPKDSKISIDLGGLKKGESFSFSVKAAEPEFVKVSGDIKTNINVISAAGYLWNKYKVLVFIIVVILLLIAGFILLCLAQYRNNVEDYSVSKKISVTPEKEPSQSRNITLNTKNTTAYLHVRDVRVYIENKKNAGECIGYFTLVLPEGSKVLQGFNYMIKGEKIFEVTYKAIWQHTIGRNAVKTLTYAPKKEMEAKSPSNNKIVTIKFY